MDLKLILYWKFSNLLIFLTLFGHALLGSFPRLHGNPLKMYFPLGAMARIPCLTNHDNTAVYWTKDGQQLNQTHMKINHQGHLYIRSTQFSDQGLYICKPYSPTSFQAHLTVLHVVVKVPVYFLVRPRPIYQRHANQSVTMPCVAVGEPAPTISWRKIGGSFPGKTKTLYDAGNLTVVQLSKEDQGQYECVAQNVVASVITTSLLIIEASPHSPPYNLTARTTFNSAKVCWLPAYDNGHPQHYVLWYKAIDEKDKDWTTMRIVPDDALCMTLHDLPPNTRFEFYILSRNRLGEGLFSTPITAATKSHHDDVQGESIDHHKITDGGVHVKKHGGGDDEDGDDDRESSGQGISSSIMEKSNVEDGYLRPLPPQNISVLKTKEGLYISWLPPVTPVEHYLIQYKTKGQWVTLSDHVKRTYFTWLTPSFGASYQFRVISFSKSHVQSEPSPVVTLDTGNPMLSENSMSTKMFATLFGVIILVLLLIGSTLTLIRSCGPKRQQSSIRYDSVKYFGPNQLEPSQKILSAKQKSETSLSPVPSEQVDKQPSHQQPLQSSLVQLSRPQTDVDSLSEQCYVNCTNHNRKVILETPI